MQLVVVTPVGPGHAVVALRCAESIALAWDFSPGAFTSIVHDRRDDTRGELGRSKARNQAIAAHPDADWFLFIDADDLLLTDAFDQLDDALYADPQLTAVFGAVCTDRDGVIGENVHPLDWRGLMKHGPVGTLSMGCFVRGDAARATPFNEAMDAAEDFDFYLRLLHERRWTKVARALVRIGKTVPSAVGPRGYVALDWREACQKIVDKWKEQTGSPYSPLKVFHHQDRLKVLREGGQPNPLHLEWSLSDLCSHHCSFCLTEGTIVDTISGPVPIERIRQGDQVHDADRGVSTVDEVSSRRVGTILEIRAGSETLRCSEEHPILCAGGFKEARHVTTADRALVRVWVRRESVGTSEDVELVRASASTKTGSVGRRTEARRGSDAKEQSNEAARCGCAGVGENAGSPRMAVARGVGENCRRGASPDADEESDEEREVVFAVDGEPNHDGRARVLEMVQSGWTADQLHGERRGVHHRDLCLSGLRGEGAEEGHRGQHDVSRVQLLPEADSRSDEGGMAMPDPADERPREVQGGNPRLGAEVRRGELLWRLEERSVSSVRRIHGDFAVFNFSCSPGESYIANGIAVHNCAFRWPGYTSNELFKVLQPDGSFNHNPNRMIPYEKAVEVLDDCVAMGIKAVQFTGGGEPTIHPRHLDIFRGALDRGLDIALVSHGNIFRPGYIPIMLRAKWVRYSLDAGTPATYASVRKVPESAFHKTLANVRELCKARDAAESELIVGIGFVVTKENWREVVRATELAKETGANNIRISAVFQPDDERYFADFHEEAAALCREAKSLEAPGFTVFNNFGERIEDLSQKSPDYSFCGQMHFTVFLGGDQQLYRCCVTSFSPRGLIGSIKDQRLKDLWESDAKRRDYEAFNARGCERCMFNGKNKSIAYALAREPAHVNFV